MSAYISDLTPEELKRNFDIYDKDGNGKIEISEMKSLFARNGAELNEGAQQYLWNKYDKNGDGMIDYYEFVEYLTGKPYTGKREINSTPQRVVISTDAGHAQFQEDFHTGYLNGYREGYFKGLQKFKEMKASGQLPTSQKSQNISSQQSHPQTRVPASSQPTTNQNWQQPLASHIQTVGSQPQETVRREGWQQFVGGQMKMAGDKLAQHGEPTGWQQNIGGKLGSAGDQLAQQGQQPEVAQPTQQATGSAWEQTVASRIKTVGGQPEPQVIEPIQSINTQTQDEEIQPGMETPKMTSTGQKLE